MTRVIGRLHDLVQRDPREGEQTLGDVLARWSLGGNREWLRDGMRRGEPFLQISTAAPGSVLAWEIAQLGAEGCVPVGPFWLPVSWLHDAERYRRTVRLVAEHVLALPARGEDVYVSKARGELEPLLAAWPWLVALPTTARWSIDDLLLARAWPIHPLGVVAAPACADGRECAPAEFFFHDVDHARFKVREDLRARGVALPDPVRDGTTFDAERGGHRRVMPAALPHLDADGWRHAALRERRVRSWLDAIGAEPDRALGEASRWLLFELLHEKSLPIDAAVLRRELASGAHVAKLRAKCAAGFYGAEGPAPAAVVRLGAASERLATWLEATP